MDGDGAVDLEAELPEVRMTPGVVVTGFGVNAPGGGADSRTMPGAQPIDEIAQAIEHPVDEVDTRPAYAKTIVEYDATTTRRASPATPSR